MVKKSHFERLAKHYDFLTKILMMGTYGSVRKRIVSTRRVEAALDLCCGTGYVSGHINAEKVIALDLSPGMLKTNKEKNESKIGFSAVVGDAFRLPFPDNSFGAVYNTLAAHEFKNISIIIEEAYRVLKKGGELRLYDFSYPKSKLLRYTYFPFLKHVVELGSFFVFDVDEWKKMLQEAGFKNISAEMLYKASVLINATK
jgi:demethylmenaquinone methyltransferase/2-methoxy-6-polyprenyl-1,4-benzoquinol methylase